MTLLLWLKGILLYRWGRMALTAAGLALGTSLLALVGLYATDSARTMTARAVTALPVDWQVALGSGSDAADASGLIQATSGVKTALSVAFADVAAMRAETGGTVQTTGRGVVLGLAPGYADAFPGQIRLLTGSLQGPLLAQQTAANLHAEVGDTVTANAQDGTARPFTIAGIVDLPNADSLFQVVGAPKGAAPTAPPDNVLLLPMQTWTTTWGAVGAGQTGRQMQIHVSLDHTGLPSDPAAAYAFVTGRVHNLEARSAGRLAVGDNLGSRLDAVREDALFAHVLLLALGLPGLALGTALTIAVAAPLSRGMAGSEHSFGRVVRDPTASSC